MDNEKNVVAQPQNKKSNKKILTVIMAMIVVIAIVAVILFTSDSRNYNKAVKLYNDNNYTSAYYLFTKLEDYEDSAKYREKCEIYIEYGTHRNAEDFENAVSVLTENETVFSDDSNYITVLNECKYLLAEQQYNNKEYVKAYNNLADNTYEKAADLQKEIKPHYESETAVDEILTTYQWMSDYLDDTYDGADWHTSNVFSSFGIDWDMFYQNKCSELDKLEKRLKTESVEDCKSAIEDFMGYVPENKKECNKIIAELKEVFVYVGLTDYDSYLIPNVMEFLTEENKYSTVERNDEKATITITEVNKYLKSKNVSAKTFAYMLGLPTMYRMDISKSSDILLIEFDKSSHCWAWCTTTENDENFEKDIDTFISKAIDDAEFLYSSNGNDFVEVDFSGIEKFDLAYLRIAFLGSDLNDPNKLLSQNHHFLDKDDLEKSTVKITVKYDSDCLYTGYIWVADITQ